MKKSASHFHKVLLKDAVHNFERNEPTVSYMLREPSDFLRGLSFGEAFRDAVIQRTEVKRAAGVLEIGGGVGVFAKGFLKRSSRPPYRIFDLSPELIREQKKTLKGLNIQWTRGDASSTKLVVQPHETVVIANEMIADLDIDLIQNSKELIKSWPVNFNRHLVGFLKRGEPVLAPTGIVKMLKRLHETMPKDGTAFISEYFSLRGTGPVHERQGHEEFTPNLALTCLLAREIGFQVVSEPLVDFLDMDLNARPLSKQMLRRLRDDLQVGVTPTRPYQAEQLKALGVRGFQEPLMSSRSDWIRIFSHYYVLTLKIRAPFNPDARFVRSANASLVKIDGRAFLIPPPWPMELIPIDDSQRRLWSSLDKPCALPEDTARVWYERGLIEQLSASG